MELVHPLFKWLHIIAGIAWIGLLYFLIGLMDILPPH